MQEDEENGSCGKSRISAKVRRNYHYWFFNNTLSPIQYTPLRLNTQGMISRKDKKNEEMSQYMEWSNIESLKLEAFEPIDRGHNLHIRFFLYQVIDFYNLSWYFYSLLLYEREQFWVDFLNHQDHWGRVEVRVCCAQRATASPGSPKPQIIFKESGDIVFL